MALNVKMTYSKINPPLVEKMIRALSLLQHVKKQGLTFIFKGGTSLLLLLENARRFSVDIDILTEVSRQEVEQIISCSISFMKNRYTQRCMSDRSKAPGLKQKTY